MKKLLSALSIVATVLSTAHTAPVLATAPPNILYILTDDLGYGDIDGLNPNNKIKTPEIDRLASSGMVFTETHSSSAVCTPSRYCILTGRYNWRSTLKSGVLGGFGHPLIEDGRMTVAELLRAHGYQTACIGKWHLGLEWPRLGGAVAAPDAPNANTDQGENMAKSKTERLPAEGGEDVDFSKPIGRAPTTLGFDWFFGISASLDMPPYTFIENDRVTALPTILNGSLHGADGKHTRIGPTAPGFDAVKVLPTFTQKAIDYIDHHADDARGGKPFFLYLALPTPHTPIAPSAEWIGRSGLNYYADYVMETDDSIGKVLAALDRDGLGSNTLVLFASDNGCSPAADFPYLLAHGHDPSAGRRGYKADIYDGGHRIPFMARWPGHVTAGSVNTNFICLGDLFATCADILGAKIPDNAAEDSISFLPLLEGRDDPNARDTLVESSNDGSFGIRQGRWKLALCPGSGGWSYPRPGVDNTDGWPRFQLFDCVADPREKTNLLDQHPDIVNRLGHLMRQYIVNGRSTPGAPQKNTPVKSWKQTWWLSEFK